MTRPAPIPEYDKTAHCRLPGVNPARFHATPRSAHWQTISVTKKLCTGGGKVPACPFVDKCREYGLAHAVSGIWGGLDDKERRAVQNGRGITPEPLMSTIIASPTSSQSQQRADSFALVACPECSREMRPGSLRRHLREKHGKRAV
jgi:hypothetical protein